MGRMYGRAVIKFKTTNGRWATVSCNTKQKLLQEISNLVEFCNYFEVEVER